MLKNAFFIARKDIRYMLQGKETILWLFIMPVVFFYFIGTITGGMNPGGSGGTAIAVHLEPGAGFLADEFVRRLEDQEYRIVFSETDEAFEAAARRLTIPAELTDSVLEGKTQAVQLTRRDTGIGGDYDTLRVGRALYTVLADLVAIEAADQTPTPETFKALRAMPRALSLEVAPAGQRQRIPTGFEQAIPGTMVMFTMIVLLTTGAVTIVIERNQGLLRRLASTPISRGEIVLGKWAGRMTLGLIQVTFAMIAGTVIFGMDWGPDLPMIMVVVAGWAAVCASMGLLLGSLARTEGQAIGIGVLSANVLAALGGCWWPIEITPEWMQAFSKLLPTGWAMGAMHRLISFQDGALSALPYVALMVGLALVFGWMGARRFRFV